MKKKIAIVVGHHRFAQGAYNADKKLTEFSFNEKLASYIKAKCPEGIDIEIVYRQPVKGSYIYLPAVLNDLEPDFIISLHCNAYNKKVSGTETLHHFNSSRGKAMATILQNNLVAYLGLPDRGLKLRRARQEKPPEAMLEKDKEGNLVPMSPRGGHILKYTEAPCVITEAFFIDNNDDVDKVMPDVAGLAQVYIDSIIEIVQKV